MKFLIDHQLPAVLCRFLVSRGAECQHVFDAGLAEAQDSEIWEQAGRDGQVVVSKDDDFVFLADRARTGAQLVWVRLGNCRSRDLLAAFERLWPQLQAALLAGDSVVEIRE